MDCAVPQSINDIYSFRTAVFITHPTDRISLPKSCLDKINEMPENVMAQNVTSKRIKI